VKLVQRFVCSLSHRERVKVREMGMGSIIIGGGIIAMHVRWITLFLKNEGKNSDYLSLFILS